jgi:hypothetical protein
MAKKALHWWYNILTPAGRSVFPKPKDVDTIIEYYLDPSQHTWTK